MTVIIDPITIKNKFNLYLYLRIKEVKILKTKQTNEHDPMTL